MRINKYVALATDLSRRGADAAIAAGRVKVNGKIAAMGTRAQAVDTVTIDNGVITPPVNTTTIMLNKPTGYVSSRSGQGNKTIYDLIPPKLHHLKPVGRLDKNSSGLLLLTNDGELAHRLTHPSSRKEKVYEVEINHPLSDKDFEKITKSGVDIGDSRPSRFQLVARSKQPVASKETPTKQLSYFLPSTHYWRVALAEGRNRQIRRTFAALGYSVTKLHRTGFGEYRLGTLAPGSCKVL